MKLTDNQVAEIYHDIRFFSQRITALLTKHSRGTIARYLRPQVMAEYYAQAKHEVSIANRYISLWKTLAIIGAIGHIFTILTYFFL